MAVMEVPSKETTQKKTMRNLSFFSKILGSVSSDSNPRSSPSTSTHMVSESTMDGDISVAESMITKWDLHNSSQLRCFSLFLENRKEAKEFIKSVEGLRRAMDFLVSGHSSSHKLLVAQKLMQTAMQRLEMEFYLILSSNRECLNPESVSSLSMSCSNSSDGEGSSEILDQVQEGSETMPNLENLSANAISDLNLIADCMINCGYAKECVRVYKITRRSIVDEGLYSLGIEQYSSSHVNKMNVEDLENQVKNWLKAVKISVRILFNGERFLCDHVFSASEPIRESCFSDISKEGAINIFKFPELVAKSKRSPIKFFLLIDLYETLFDILPEIESIFKFESVSSVKLQAYSSLQKLGESVLVTLEEFETSIQKNSSKTPIPGGGIHPLTSSVMKFVSLLANYSGVLTEIMDDSSTARQSPLSEAYFTSGSEEQNTMSAVPAHLAWIILVLLCKLDAKAKLYNEIALAYLFLANNLQYVLEKVHSTELKCLLGEDWISNHERKLRQYVANYETIAWTKVFSCLPENTTTAMSPEAVKGCFRQFNAAFEETYRKQSSWVVPNGRLRDEIKVSIARKLVPAYQEFYDTYFSTLSQEKNLEVLVRYSPDNLGNYLSDLFHGNSVSGSSSSSPSSRHVSRCLPYM